MPVFSVMFHIRKWSIENNKIDPKPIRADTKIH